MNALDGYGRAAIHYAAEQDATCVELLLAANADPNIRDDNQDTALHWASFKNKPKCARVSDQGGNFMKTRVLLHLCNVFSILEITSLSQLSIELESWVTINALIFVSDFTTEWCGCKCY